MAEASLPRPPLSGLRVVDMVDEKGELCGRLLAELGADVIRVEPPNGAPSRRRPPYAPDGSGLHFAFRNAGKRGVSVDLASTDDQARLRRLLDWCDVWVHIASPATLTGAGLDPEGIRASRPELIVASISDFGASGPYRDWKGSEIVDFALGGSLPRLGPPGKAPVSPPSSVAYDIGGIQAALAILMAHLRKLRTGVGESLEVSIVEAVAATADWAIPSWSVSHTHVPRSGPGLHYPIYRCVDGYVRAVVPLLPKQLSALREWLGNPPELAGAEWEDMAVRLAKRPVLDKHILHLLDGMTRVEAASEGQRRGLLITPVLWPGELLDNEHVRARATFMKMPISRDMEGVMFAGFFELNGERLSVTGPAPTLGEQNAETASTSELASVPAPPATEVRGMPFAGLRVLDFGIGAAGAEAGRLFAEYGADVIKVEMPNQLDFMHVTPGSFMNPLYASANRTKRSLGINLRTPEGLALLHRLVAVSDVVIENSRPGTMEWMGVGYDVLRRLNPRIILASSHMLGSRGPWSEWGGYGPNVAAVSGLSYLWNHPEDTDPPVGVSTIYPDHVMGRLLTIGATAALIKRHQTTMGAHVEAAQFETVMGLLGDLLLKESLAPGSVGPEGNRRDTGVPWNLFPCAGEDAWCAITVRDDEEWRGLRRALGEPGWACDHSLETRAGRFHHREAIEKRLAVWTRTRDSREVMNLLQTLGVPAAMVQGPGDQLEDPHFRARGFARPIDQPLLGPVLFEGPGFRGSGWPEPDIRPAPDLGEHTRAICRELLGLDDDVVNEMVSRGVLAEPGTWRRS
jgi:crotonobetainyl-CoA:carnitine CoA-transferase CaiB-like acyl-CoA transferase